MSDEFTRGDNTQTPPCDEQEIIAVQQALDALNAGDDGVSLDEAIARVRRGAVD
jgi:hypothetical protein